MDLQSVTISCRGRAVKIISTFLMLKQNRLQTFGRMSSTEDSDVTSSRSGSTSSLGILPTIDDFEIIKPISRGAYAKVYLGYKRQHPSKHYAIKVGDHR